MTLTERFWQRVNVSDENACWLWQGSVVSQKRPYGVFYVGYDSIRKRAQLMLAHRYSYILTHGSIPEGLLVCHQCDNPQCVNPNHLFTGTYSDNSQDMKQKGRGRGKSRPGALGTKAKLTWEQVDWLRSDEVQGSSQRELAEQLGVTPSTISKIRRYDTWKDRLNGQLHTGTTD
jgi:hypothetical protein